MHENTISLFHGAKAHNGGMLQTSERQTRVKSLLSASPLSLAVGVARRGTSMAGVLMLGLAVIRISLHEIIVSQ